ncbi:MAG TPA: beta-galactosidase [Caldilineaceae bacterium]|nr:beta-galactosidase [Caldilineaceae bacterium]
MPSHLLPTFPYGAVYFRKSNPPRADWERDYRTAAEDGMNSFRHWFMWSAIEIAPGEYDWEEYDQQLDLAAANGMKTIIAEMITAAPEWAYRRYAHARYQTRDGQPVHPQISGSAAVGGFPGLCLDNDDYRALAEGFLIALATRYKGHPGLGGYDIWNECNIPPHVCYCPATQEKFRQWLREKYGDLRTLGKAWRRYSFAEWEDVTPPYTLGPYPDTLDWLQFRIDNAHAQMRWRAQTIRKVDDACAITAHGLAMSLARLPQAATDDWRAAAEVESYGVTWGSSRHGDEPWKQMQAFDLIRASSRGKPFWHAETYAGPLWMQPQVLNKPRDEGRIAKPEDIRYWDLVSYMAGATGMFYLRWRPLLDGPLFGAFGAYGMDGSRTPRSEMVSRVGKWATAPEQQRLWQSRPVRGEVGIVVAPETQLFLFAQQGSTEFYTHSTQGAYRGFWENNIQADWVHIDDVNPHAPLTYSLLYLPVPVMLSQATAQKLAAWVAAGGTLVVEGCPAYFGDAGHVGVVQPNYGLDEVLGARESYVEFTPDLLTDLRLTVQGYPLWGGIFQQAYRPTTGKAAGWYADGQVAAVENRYGKGRTLLIGTMIGAGHVAHPGNATTPALATPFFAALLKWAGIAQHVTSSDARVKARLHNGEGGRYLWIANPTRQPVPVRLTVGQAWGPFTSARTLWGAEATCCDATVELTAPARDVTVLELS